MDKAKLMAIAAIAFVLMVATTGPTGAAPLQDVYIEGLTSFSVEPGKLYHWKPAAAEVKPAAGGSAAPGQQAELDAPAPGMLTEEGIRQMIEDFKEAVRNRDAGAISGQIAPDAVIYINIATHSGRLGQVLTPKQYVESLRESWAKATRYEYDVANIVIRISEDGQSATVDSDVSETVEMQGKLIKGKAHEQASVEVLDGRLQITKITGHVSF